MTLRFNRVLVLGAHPDDEMGCGGLISKLVEEGVEVHHYYFSDCAKSTIARGFPPEQLLEECEKSRKILGILPRFSGARSFPVREFPAHRQEILEELVLLKGKIKPDLVLTANTSDFHQDHRTLTEESIRAFRHASILGYELPWNNLEFASTCLFRLERRHIDAKIASVQSYITQKEARYTRAQYIESIARVRGLQANCDFAECYEVIRLLV